MSTNPKIRMSLKRGFAIVAATIFASAAYPVASQELRFPAMHVTDAVYHRVEDRDEDALASGDDSDIAVPILSADSISLSAESAETYGPTSGLARLGGFIDSAVIQSQFRIRFDSASNGTFPDRAVYQFAPRSGVFEIDYTEISAYLEYAIRPRLSVVADLPIRFVEVRGSGGTTDTEQGAGDLNFGIRYQAFQDCQRAVAFQVLVRTPTGVAGDIGIGETNFVDVPLGLSIPRIEPGILFQSQSQRDDRSTVFGEFKVNVPLEEVTDPGLGITENFAGTVLRYGLGVGYDVFHDCCNDRRLTSVAEFVGWTVLGGLKTNPAGPPFDGEDTIFNIKVGARWTQGNRTFYGGYSRAITDQVWYEGLFRADYAVRF